MVEKWIFTGKWVCGWCNYQYDPKEGAPESGVKPGTPFEDLPEDWPCPGCGISGKFHKQMKKEEGLLSKESAT